MDQSDIKLLEDAGWTVICESPFEIEKMSEDKMVIIGEARGIAAEIILDYLRF
jgi:hypothetical protein